jgi:anti-sigma factor RsiW
MKWFLSSCRRYRESVCLLASGLLPEQDRAGIESHLAVCAECQNYYDEIKALTTPLAGWEKHFAHIEPHATIHLRLAKAITPANKPKSIRPFAPKMVLRECWQQLVWPSRRIWAGLATVWILILAANLSMQDHSQPALAKASPVPEVIMTWRQQERLLAELIGPNEIRAAQPPKPYLPRPSSERRFESLMT